MKWPMQCLTEPGTPTTPQSKRPHDLSLIHILEPYPVSEIPCHSCWRCSSTTAAFCSQMQCEAHTAHTHTCSLTAALWPLPKGMWLQISRFCGWQGNFCLLTWKKGHFSFKIILFHLREKLNVWMFYSSLAAKYRIEPNKHISRIRASPSVVGVFLLFKSTGFLFSSFSHIQDERSSSEHSYQHSNLFSRNPCGLQQQTVILFGLQGADK